MIDSGARPRSRTRLALTLLLGLLASACQSAMSLEEAKKVAATFTGSEFVPPPRTINDITAILDQQKRADPQAAAQARARADQPPPDTADPGSLATFYYERGLAAREIGRPRQEIDDLTKALANAANAQVRSAPPTYEILYDLGVAELNGGNYSRFVEYRRKAIEAVPLTSKGLAWSMVFNSSMAMHHAAMGDLKAAEAALAETSRIFYETVRWPNQPPDKVATREALFAQAQAAVLEAKGRYAEAEAFWRQAVVVLVAAASYSNHWWLDFLHSSTATNLTHQGRLIEAEVEARRALLGALEKRGRYSPHTASMLRRLVEVLRAEGRYREAETLARAAVEIYEKTGTSPDSAMFAHARWELATALAFQRRYQEALGEYEAVGPALARDPEYAKILARGDFSINHAMVLMATGKVDKALEVLAVALEKSQRLVGDAHRNTAEIRGSIAQAYGAKGDSSRALKEFREATRVLLTPLSHEGDENTTRAAADERLAVILASYIGLLADIKGTPIEREGGGDPIAEAFRLADAARGRSVQRALNQSAARAAAKTPALADLVRKEQEVAHQIDALYRGLAGVLALPTDQHDPKLEGGLRSQLDILRRARESLIAQIEREFPSYAGLLDPKPATLEQARAVLRPGEALIATLVTRDRTFVWAVPQSGPAAFAAAPMGANALEEAVATLRKALEPRARTLGDIPDFDLALAHRLYSALLEPVRSGWEQARSLLVVADGPLGQLPLGLLPTRPVSLPPESGAIFSNYRQVPWLVRTHAVTVLPTVASLATLRALPPGDPGRRPFVGFGDPYFSQEQAAAAASLEQRTLAAAGESPPAEVVALATRAVPVRFRSSPEAFDSSQLARLPRLPDTAEEIRSLALAMSADPTRDVFLGARANEKTVKTMDLAGYRVLAFATHGLVPGDLDGLTQPALALSAPDVAGVEGDGLLTMDEILALRLNADWIILSACNTASGQGAGAEAVSGLGRAFFYAGTRALLVSNWPVETTSARALTTDLFRRQQGSLGLDRAQALQQTLTWLIDQGVFVDAKSQTIVFSYAHPIFWAPFTLIGDGGSDASRR